MKELRLVILTS